MTIWIVGPCSMESPELYFRTGAELCQLMKGRRWYFKASFDKANRSAMSGQRGPGFQRGRELFHEFRRRYPDIRLLTDVHECHQVEPLVSCVDAIQVPAFLCRQTDLLVECGRHFGTTVIKKGQWLGPDNIIGAADKVRSQNSAAQVWLCERGTQLGYERLVIDFRTVNQFSSAFDEVLLDCTHSTQMTLPSGRTGGDRDLAEKYVLAAPIFGYSGIFAEVHPTPPTAISDGDCQIFLSRLGRLVRAHDAVERDVRDCFGEHGRRI